MRNIPRLLFPLDVREKYVSANEWNLSPKKEGERRRVMGQILSPPAASGKEAKEA